jgi:tRNA-modifying protein YgfZ
MSFLVRHGAVVEDGLVSHFGNPEKERFATSGETILADLSHLSLIRVQGDDARSFLNSQLSIDVSLLDDRHSQLAAYCNAKGRMLALFRLFRRGAGYYLQLPAPLQDAITDRLRLYVLRAKVILASADQELRCFGLAGPKVADLLDEAGLPPPQKDDTCATVNDITLLRMPGSRLRYEIVAPTATAIQLWERLQTTAAPVGAGCWSWLDIHAGVPTILPQTSEAFVPQMTNLDALEAINFKKGCYPGQEIVARMHYLGRLKQRMYLAHIDNDTPPKPGDVIVAPDLPNQTAGTVVDAQPAPAGGHDLLVVMQITSAQAGEARLHDASGSRLRLQPLPYSLPPTKMAAKQDFL